MRLRIRLTIDLGRPVIETTPPTGPDIEPQIGTHHDAEYVDAGMGFTTPANTPRWGDE